MFVCEGWEEGRESLKTVKKTESGAHTAVRIVSAPSNRLKKVITHRTRDRGVRKAFFSHGRNQPSAKHCSEFTWQVIKEWPGRITLFTRNLNMSKNKKKKTIK